MLHILIIVFSILMALVALGFIIGGLIKKKQKTWIISLIAFVLFIMLTVFAILSSVRRTVNYLGSEEFQEDTKEQAENLGKTWGNTVSGTAKGLDETLDEDAIIKLANKGAKSIGKGVKAVASGFDETTGKTTIFQDESIDKYWITVGRAERIKDSLVYSFGLYLEFEKNFEGKLVLTAYDEQGLKKDKSELIINEQAGHGKVFVFQFEYFKPGLNGYCILKKE